MRNLAGYVEESQVQNNETQAGSFFGAQEANRTLHAIYTYGSGNVTIDNLGGTPRVT